MTTYKIRRYYRDDRPARDVKGLKGLTLEQAQAHCNDPKTRKVRNGEVVWFDGFVREE